MGSQPQSSILPWGSQTHTLIHAHMLRLSLIFTETHLYPKAQVFIVQTNAEGGLMLQKCTYSSKITYPWTLCSSTTLYLLHDLLSLPTVHLLASKHFQSPEQEGGGRVFKRDTQGGQSQGPSNVKSPFFYVARSSHSLQPTGQGEASRHPPPIGMPLNN